MPRFLVILLLVLLAARPVLGDAGLMVEFVTVTEDALTYDAALTGTVHATDTVDIGFRLGGRVVDVLVNEGDLVTQGQSLARTDPLQQEQALRVAEAAVTAAMAATEQARQASVRAEAMLERGVGTRAELESTGQILSSTGRSLAQAHANRDQAVRALQDTVIRAPSDAIVTARRAEPGQIVGAAQPVISLASSTGREAVFQTPDTPLLRDAIGARVSLDGLDFPDLHMRANVTEIGPLVDAATGSVTVRAEIDDPPPDFDLLGVAVRGAVHFPVGKGISVPWTALTSTKGKSAVWVVGHDGRVELAEVGIERFMNGIVILNDGLRPGQIVVGAGSQKLYPGRLVVDRAAAAPPE